MAFIGNTVQNQGFVPAVDYFTGNGSTTAFTLSRPVASVAQVEAVIENVVQNPGSAFTVSGNTITFASAPPVPYGGGSNNIYIRYTSPITQVNALSQAPSVIGPMSVGINGAVGIGGTTNPIINMSGASTNYVQAYVNNTTNGGSSSADLVAYPNNGTDSHGWVDMGITSLGYNDTTYTVTGPNESYLFGSAPSGSSTTGNLVIATDNTGTSNSIQFYTNGFTQAKSAAKMVIDGATGNVGIGTSSPGTKLNVYTGSATNTLIRAQNTAGYIDIGALSTGAVYGGYSTGGSYTLGTSDANPILFYSNGSERMRIDSSGNLGIGTTSGTARLYVKSNSNTAATTFVIERSDTTDKWGQIIDSSNNYYFNLNVIGKAYINNSSGNWTPDSDQRAKKDITDIQYGLKEVLALHAVTYRMNEDAETSKKHLGFIAQEVKAVVDEAVDDVQSEEQFYGLDKSVLVPVLVKAIQELNATITAQATTITTMQAQITALQAKVGV